MLKRLDGWKASVAVEKYGRGISEGYSCSLNILREIILITSYWVIFRFQENSHKIKEKKWYKKNLILLGMNEGLGQMQT